MKNLCNLLPALAAALTLPAAAQTPAPPADKVYTYVEQMPQLPGGGGQAAVVVAIQQHVSYPPRAMRAHAEGRVFVGFTVAASGLVEDVGLVKGFRPDCDSTVVAAVKQLPRFRPGMQAGQCGLVALVVQLHLPAEIIKAAYLRWHNGLEKCEEIGHERRYRVCLVLDR